MVSSIMGRKTVSSRVDLVSVISSFDEIFRSKEIVTIQSLLDNNGKESDLSESYLEGIGSMVIQCKVVKLNSMFILPCSFPANERMTVFCEEISNEQISPVVKSFKAHLEAPFASNVLRIAKPGDFLFIESPKIVKSEVQPFKRIDADDTGVELFVFDEGGTNEKNSKIYILQSQNVADHEDTQKQGAKESSSPDALSKEQNIETETHTDSSFVEIVPQDASSRTGAAAPTSASKNTPSKETERTETVASSRSEEIQKSKEHSTDSPETSLSAKLPSQANKKVKNYSAEGTIDTGCQKKVENTSSGISYKKLNECKPANNKEKFNVWAVCTKISKEPGRTKGRLFMAQVYIQDQDCEGSYGHSDMQFSLMASEMNHFPPLQENSVLRIHHMVMQEWNGSWTGRVYDARSVVVIPGRVDDPITPQYTSDPRKFSWTDVDEEKVKELRLWWSCRNFSQDADLVCHRMQLCALKSPLTFDIYCKVVKKIRTNCDIALRITDGTACSLTLLKTNDTRDPDSPDFKAATEEKDVDVFFSGHEDLFNQIEEESFIMLNGVRCVQEKLKAQIDSNLVEFKAYKLIIEEPYSASFFKLDDNHSGKRSVEKAIGFQANDRDESIINLDEHLRTIFQDSSLVLEQENIPPGISNPSVQAKKTEQSTRNGALRIDLMNEKNKSQDDTTCMSDKEQIPSSSNDSSDGEENLVYGKFKGLRRGAKKKKKKSWPFGLGKQNSDNSNDALAKQVSRPLHGNTIKSVKEKTCNHEGHGYNTRSMKKLLKRIEPLSDDEVPEVKSYEVNKDVVFLSESQENSQPVSSRTRKKDKNIPSKNQSLDLTEGFSTENESSFLTCQDDNDVFQTCPSYRENGSSDYLEHEDPTDISPKMSTVPSLNHSDISSQASSVNFTSESDDHGLDSKRLKRKVPRKHNSIHEQKKSSKSAKITRKSKRKRVERKKTGNNSTESSPLIKKYKVNADRISLSSSQEV